MFNGGDTDQIQLADNFDHLLLRALPTLRKQAMRLTRHRANAEDLVQATVTNALAAQDSFRNGTNFRSWISCILRNRFFSDIRLSRPTVDIDSVPPSQLGRNGNQEDNLIVQDLRRLLLRLPAKQRLILLMIAVEGASYKDASKQLGVASGTLKCQVFRARAQLQSWMIDEKTAACEAPRRKNDDAASFARRPHQELSATG